MKLSIWVTKTCNMACSYCYEEGLIREDTGVCEIDYIEKTIEFIAVTTGISITQRAVADRSLYVSVDADTIRRRASLQLR